MDKRWWEDNFRDFYFERENYSGRELGIDGYIKFIKQVEDASQTKACCTCSELSKKKQKEVKKKMGENCKFYRLAPGIEEWCEHKKGSSFGSEGCPCRYFKEAK